MEWQNFEYKLFKEYWVKSNFEPSIQLCDSQWVNKKKMFPIWQMRFVFDLIKRIFGLFYWNNYKFF
jgi:hypothetical protein